MWAPDLEAAWSGLTERMLAGMKAWRAAHPRATLTEIEQEVDARMADARARLLAATATGATPAIDAWTNGIVIALGDDAPDPAWWTDTSGGE
jgi:hypothetical protein